LYLAKRHWNGSASGSIFVCFNLHSEETIAPLGTSSVIDYETCVLDSKRASSITAIAAATTAVDITTTTAVCTTETTALFIAGSENASV
jgi:hypothetical protein